PDEFRKVRPLRPGCCGKDIPLLWIGAMRGGSLSWADRQYPAQMAAWHSKQSHILYWQVKRAAAGATGSALLFFHPPPGSPRDDLAKGTAIMTKVSLDNLQKQVEAIFRNAGVNEAQAPATARVIVAGERDACKSHGIYRI